MYPSLNMWSTIDEEVYGGEFIPVFNENNLNNPYPLENVTSSIDVISSYFGMPTTSPTTPPSNPP